jgi:predicted acyltransferase
MIGGKLTPVPAASLASAPARLLSLDAFRGITMASMVIVNNPGDWGNVYPPLLHAEWHGWTPTDLIFPFFLFIVGVAITLSRKAGSPRAIVIRSAKLIGLGLFLNGFPWYQIWTMRFPGVLQRIGLCYLVAAFAWRWFAPRGDGSRWDGGAVARIAALALLLLVGYWIVLLAVPGATGQRYDLTPEGNVGAMIDRAVMQGHLWKPTWDPEGLFSTVPAIGTTLLGLIAGMWLASGRSRDAKTLGLVAGGVVGVAVGLAWAQVFPINKPIWTSSYAVFTAGAGALLLAACYWVIDVRNVKRWAHPFVVLGVNAIALFVLSGLIARTLGIIRMPRGEGTVSLKAVLYESVFLPLASPVNASLLFALTNLVLLYGVLWVMYRRGVFLKV